MPYRKYARRRGARRGRSRRTQMGPGGYDYNNLARKAMSGVKFLKTLINTEKKILDTSVVAQAVSNIGSVQWLSGITNGTGYNQRTGIVVKAHSLSMRGNIVVSPSAQASQVRVIVFYNKSLNQSSVPTITDIIQNTSTPLAPYQIDNLGDFTVLYDRKFDVTNQTTSRSFSFKRKLGHHIRWDTAGDLISDAESGQIFIALLSDESTNQPTIDYWSRLRFIDN